MGNNYVRIINNTEASVDVAFHRGGSYFHALKPGESFEVNEYEVFINDISYDVSASQSYVKSVGVFKLSYQPWTDRSMARLTIDESV
jgi:hypothetical protein